MARPAGKRTRKSAKRKAKADIVNYVFVLDEWDWDFWFGVSKMPEYDGPYADYRHLNFKGRLLRPEGIRADKVELTLIPDPRLNADHRERQQPVSVGSITARAGEVFVVVAIPADLLPPVLVMLNAGRLPFAVLSGEKLRYGRAMVTDIRLQNSLDEEDDT